MKSYHGSSKLKKSVFILLTLFLFNMAFAQTQFWQQTNGPNSGAVYSLATGSTSFVFAGSDNGVFRSSDYGRTWQKKGLNGFSVLGFIAIEPDSIYAAIYGGGVHLSYDNGNTWTSINDSLSNLNSTCIRIDNKKNLFVGTRGGGVFFRQFGAATWVSRNVGLPNHNIRCLAINSGGTAIVGIDSSKLFRSTDSGLTWSPSSTGLTNIWTNSLISNEDGDFFVATEAGVYRSTDDGLSWIGTNNGLTNIFVSGVYASPDQRIFAATSGGGAFRSTDNGNSWNRIINIGDGRSFVVTKPNHILHGSNRYGLFSSTDDGDTWDLVGLPVVRVSEMFAHKSGSIFANHVGSGNIYRSSNKGDSWHYSAGFGVSRFATNRTGVIYAGSGGGIFQSTDIGNTWTLLSDKIFGGVASLLVDSSDVMYAGAYSVSLYDGPAGGGLYRSTDGGSSWTHKWFYEIPPPNTVSLLATNSRGHIFAGVGFTLHRSTDGGATWLRLPLWSYATSIAITSGGSIYVGSAYDGLRYSTDNGDTWDQAPLKATNIQCLFVSPDDAVYCGTQNDGVFVRRTTDTSFTPLNSGLTSQGILSLIADQAGHLYAGSYDGGVFRSTNPITSLRRNDEPIPLSFSLHQNHPNPFNPSTTIQYELPRSSFVNLAVYNILGQQIAQLVNEQQSFGRKQIVFQNNGIPSGIYIYRLQTSGHTESKKMLLLK